MWGRHDPHHGKGVIVLRGILSHCRYAVASATGPGPIRRGGTLAYGVLRLTYIAQLRSEQGALTVG